MESDISNIRINDWFWVKFGTGFVSFGYKGLPDDVHFTLSLSEKADDYNIHLTRNIGTDPRNKPKIEIVRINKKILEKIGPYSALNLIYTFLKPLDVNPIIKSKRKTKFISIESLESGPRAKELESHVIESFKPISKIKSKGRFRIEGPLESVFENVLQNEQYLDSIFDSCVDFKDIIDQPTRGGMLMYSKKSIPILKINNEWFEFSPEVNPMELLSSIVGDDWANAISDYTKLSLDHITAAKDYEETKPWNTPIILVANPEFESAIDNQKK
jgi:hypothetical protein